MGHRKDGCEHTPQRSLALGRVSMGTPRVTQITNPIRTLTSREGPCRQSKCKPKMAPGNGEKVKNIVHICGQPRTRGK